MKLSEELNTINKNTLKLKGELEEAKAEAENYKYLVTSLQRKIVKVQNEALEA
jgi:predicted  nucleic acid-binding Zn-ribbon protein